MNDDAVRAEIRVEAPADVVFDLFTKADLLARWIGIAAELEPQPGGLFRFELKRGEFCSGRYLEVIPNRRVVFTWGWESDALPVPPGSSTVEVELTEIGGSTLVMLTHSGLAPDVRAIHEEGWGRFLPRLAAIAEGRDPGDDPAKEELPRREASDSG